MKDSSAPPEGVQFPRGDATSGCNLLSGLSASNTHTQTHEHIICCFFTCYQNLITDKIDLIRLDRWQHFLQLDPPPDLQKREIKT